jgi:hypothetical protein
VLDIVPSGSRFEIETWPQSEPDLREDLLGMGVHFTFPGDQLNFLLHTVQNWFENRDEVVLIDYGITDKQDKGVIVMEWEESDIDQLFLDILRTDPMIEDFTVYERRAE